MTIVFPRYMPENGAMQHSFEPQRVDYISPETGARVGSVTAGWPLWHMTLGLNNLKSDDADIWRAWLAAQRGSQRLFYAYDLSRPVPKAYADGGSYTTAPSGWSQTIDASGSAILALSGLSAGMVLSRGDYIGFTWGQTKRSLVRAVERVVAASDGTVSATIEPAVHAVTPADALVNLDHPTCLMRLVTANTQLGDQMYGGLWTAAGGKIEAIQELLP